MSFVTYVPCPDGKVLLEGTPFSGLGTRYGVTRNDLCVGGDRPNAYIIGKKVEFVNAHTFAGWTGNIEFEDTPIGESYRPLTLHERCFSHTCAASIVLPERTHGIGNNVFEHSQITRFIAPPLRFMGSAAFYQTQTLRIVDLRKTHLYHVRKNVFALCNSLEELHLPTNGTLISIEPRAFYNCRMLRDFNIPDSVKRIGKEAFRGCQSLMVVVLPPDIELVGHGAFSNCRLLRILEFPSKRYTTYSDRGSRLFIESFIVADCINLGTLVLPQGYTHRDTGEQEYVPQMDFSIWESPISAMHVVADANHRLTGARTCKRYTFDEFKQAHKNPLLSMAYWNKSMHAWRPTFVANNAVMAVFLCMSRLRKNAATTKQPGLPPELWVLILSFVQQSELGLQQNRYYRTVNGRTQLANCVHGNYSHELLCIVKGWYNIRLRQLINDYGFKTRCVSIAHGILTVECEIWDEADKAVVQHLPSEILTRIRPFVPCIQQIQIKIVPVFAALTIQSAWRAFKQRAADVLSRTPLKRIFNK